MKEMLKSLTSRLRALHRDEQGADMVEYILIIAAVSLPLLGIVIWYWQDISKWALGLWEGAKRGEPKDPHDI